MAITLLALIEALRIAAPHGVELPRDQDTNEVHEATIERWVQEAARQINARRGRTTLKETSLTLIADQQDYALPADCREIDRIIRSHPSGGSCRVLGLPTTQYGCINPLVGRLPSGQSITPALDFLARSQVRHAQEDDFFELIGGNLRVQFPFSAGEIVTVRYKAVDSDYSSLSDDREQMIVDYLRYMVLDWYIGKYGAAIASDGDRFGSDTISVFMRQKAELKALWEHRLNSIGPEAN